MSAENIKSILSEKMLDGDGQALKQVLQQETTADVEKALTDRPGYYSFQKLLALISPAAENYLEEMAQAAHKLTIQRFGKTIRLYAPLYLSNYCINSCLYCGFNKNSSSERKRLTIEQASAEADILASEGFSDILLVAGEDREFISIDYFSKLSEKLRKKFSFIAAEIYQLTTEEYKKLFDAGIEGITIYQETYNRQVYSYFHPGGPKSDYDRRLEAADSIAQAGMREIGLGALLGLSDFRFETLALAGHAHYLMKRYWESRISFSFPRLRPADSVRCQFKHQLSDKNLVQMMTALRLCFADAGLVLSTREMPHLRDHLIMLGITKMSAGSKTNPGGYSKYSDSLSQFEIADERTPLQIAELIKLRGLEPVWKDWDKSFIKS